MCRLKSFINMCAGVGRRKYEGDEVIISPKQPAALEETITTSVKPCSDTVTVMG